MHARGKLVTVVGPSGAGKDTLIRLAAEKLSTDPRFVFPRRIITRAPEESEGNIFMDHADFDRAYRDGAFVVSWEAHGHHYAIDSSIQHDLACGRCVIVNVSRSVIAPMRAKWPQIFVVMVTASETALRARLLARGREADVGARLSRAQTGYVHSDPVADLTLFNEGPVGPKSDQFIWFLNDVVAS